MRERESEVEERQRCIQRVKQIQNSIVREKVKTETEDKETARVWVKQNERGK